MKVGPSLRQVVSLRALLLLGAGVASAAVVTVVAADASPTDAAGVARMLGDAVHGQVEPTDFVWAPGSSALSDAVLGRWVVFAARTEGEAARDVYLARVRLTRAGRPFDVASARRLTETPYGDEHGLTMTAGRVAFQTDVAGDTRAITVISGLLSATDQARPRLVQVRLGPGEGPLAHEIEGAELLVAARGGALAARVELEGDTLEVEPGLAVDVVRADADALVLAPAATWAGDSLAARWPRVDASAPPPVVPGGAPALPAASVVVPSRTADADPLVTRTDDVDDAVAVVAFDMRQLDAWLVPGNAPGVTRSGLLGRGRWPTDDARVVAAMLGPAAPEDAWVGVFDGVPIQPPSPALEALSLAHGKLLLSPVGIWPNDAQTALQLPRSNDASPRNRAALCINEGGQMAYVTGEHINPERLSMACARWGGTIVRELVRNDERHGVWARGEGGLRPVVGAPGDAPAFGKAQRDHVLVLTEHVEELPPALAGLSWAPARGDQPTPAFVPAIWEAFTEELGEKVRVVRIAPGRLTWRLRAGTEERSHREGGDFPEELPEAETSRALFAFSVGVGKRRGPNGLRIDGSTGHKFRGNPVLSAVGTSLQIGEGLSDDAVELEASVKDGQLVARARERGPRQRRADVCLLDDGAVLLAEATSDNHEVTATVLVRLGCLIALVLDRGAEREAWSAMRGTDPAVGASHVETAFIGLDTALQGRARY